MEARERSGSSSSSSSSSSSHKSSHSGSPEPSSPPQSPAPPVQLVVEQPSAPIVEQPTITEPNESVQATFTINLVQKEQQSSDEPPASEVAVSEPPRVDVDATIPDLPVTDDKTVGDDDNQPLIPPIKIEEPLVTDEVSVQPHLPSDTVPLLKDEEKQENELPATDEHEKLTKVDLIPTSEKVTSLPISEASKPSSPPANQQSEKVTSLPKSETSKPMSPTKTGADEKTSLLSSGGSQTKYSSSKPVTTSESSKKKCCACCVLV